MGDSDFLPLGGPKPRTYGVEIWHDWLLPAHDPTCQNWYTPR